MNDSKLLHKTPTLKGKWILKQFLKRLEFDHDWMPDEELRAVLSEVNVTLIKNLHHSFWELGSIWFDKLGPNVIIHVEKSLLNNQWNAVLHSLTGLWLWDRGWTAAQMAEDLFYLRLGELQLNKLILSMLSQKTLENQLLRCKIVRKLLDICIIWCSLMLFQVSIIIRLLLVTLSLEIFRLDGGSNSKARCDVITLVKFD